MAHIANRAVWEQRSKGEIKRLCESVVEVGDSRERRVAGDCVVTSLGKKGKYSRGLIPLADMFTNAEERGRGKKIAFENAPVNLRKDMKHLFLLTL